MRAEPVEMLKRLVQSRFGCEESTWELVHNLENDETFCIFTVNNKVRYYFALDLLCYLIAKL